MGTLYIDRKNVELRHEGVRLLVYEEGKRTGSIPIAHLDRMVINNRAVLDTQLLGVLAEHGVSLLILNRRRPERTARLPGRTHNDVGRRLAQYRYTLDEPWRVRWSVALIIRKLRAQYRLLKEALTRRSDKRHALITAIRALEDRQGNLQNEKDTDRHRIRGIEGAAAAAYFRGYCSLFAPALEFEGRNRRPPRDPVNACLSLAYTILHSEAVFESHGAGLDPLIGFYHDIAFGRESLACDLIEPLRPRVDAWVWWLFREHKLRLENFSKDKGACLLTKTDRQTFYSQYELFAPPLRKRLRRHAQLLAHLMTSNQQPLR